MSDERPPEHHDARELAREGARQATRPVALVVAVVALLAVLGFVVAQRFVLDPYRPGTTHDVTLLQCPGVAPDYVYLGDQTWVAEDGRVTGTVAGEAPKRTGRLKVTSASEATFTPTGGGAERPFQRSKANSPCVPGGN